ncbi:phage antirepressor N-terminal domain-containing protein [Singulisphaera acidiphila]|nr:phage antirepressor N-terminal domain-containing protein [Singulisphaera acidiphila]
MQNVWRLRGGERTLGSVSTTADGRIWVSIRSVCDALKIAMQSQLTKLRSSDFDWTCVTMIVMQVGGQNRQVAMIDLESLPMWLVTIKPSKVAFERS